LFLLAQIPELLVPPKLPGSP